MRIPPVRPSVPVPVDTVQNRGLDQDRPPRFRSAGTVTDMRLPTQRSNHRQKMTTCRCTRATPLLPETATTDWPIMRNMNEPDRQRFFFRSKFLREVAYQARLGGRAAEQLDASLAQDDDDGVWL